MFRCFLDCTGGFGGWFGCAWAGCWMFGCLIDNVEGERAVFVLWDGTAGYGHRTGIAVHNSDIVR